jgi:hypothetical protein
LFVDERALPRQYGKDRTNRQDITEQQR